MNNNLLKNIVKNFLKKLPYYNPKNLYYSIGFCCFDGKHYYVKSNKICYVIYERGKCLEERSTSNLEQGVFWILKDVTWNLALNYELNNRVEYQDSRRIWMKKWRELFSYFGEPYISMLDKEIESILHNAPFNDTNSIMLDLYQDYEDIASGIFNLDGEYECKLNAKKILSYRQPSGGIPNFENTFYIKKNEIKVIYNYFKNLKSNDSNIESIITEIDRTSCILKNIN